MARPVPPAVPEDDLKTRGWMRSEDRTETVFDGFGVSVESRTLVYEDSELRSAVVDAGGPDRIWRFLFVSRLQIVPAPAFGAHAAVRPRVLRESKQSFAEELRDRGVERIERGESRRIELAGDRHARLTPYRGRLAVEKDPETPTRVDIVGRLALWYDDGFYIAGCAGPDGSVDGWVEAETDGEELFDLIRTVA